MSRAVVLLSGGLDSATALGIAKERDQEIFCITMMYGQKNKREIESAKNLAAHYGAKEHKMITINMGDIGGSALLDDSIAIPDGQEERGDIPVTYVPARNIIFLSIATSYAEVIGAEHIYLGVNYMDYSGYPDCRDTFINAFQEVVNVGTKAGTEGNAPEVIAPLLYMTKAEIVAKGNELKVPYGMTWSCYKGGEKACGKCDSCMLRLKGFKELGLKDPVEYEVRG